MWRQDDILMSLEAPARNRLPDEPSLEALHNRVTRPGPRALLGCYWIV